MDNFELNNWVDGNVLGHEQWDYHVYDEDINYCEYLDATARAEKEIPEDARYDYIEALKAILGFEPDEGGHHCEFALTTATPRQRCEAIYEIRGQLKPRPKPWGFPKLDKRGFKIDP